MVARFKNPHELVWRVSSSGGSLPLSSTVTARPSVSIYADGRAIVAPARWPMLGGPPLRRGTVSQSALGALVGAVDKSHFFDGPVVDFGRPGVTDVGNTVVTYRTPDNRLVTRSVYGLQFLSISNGLRIGQAKERQRLVHLIRESIAAVHQTGRYVADRVELLATVTGRSRLEPTLRWPGRSLDAALDGTTVFGSGQRLRCGVVTRGIAARVQQEARADTAATWTDDTTPSRLLMVPLLPAERPRCGSIR